MKSSIPLLIASSAIYMEQVLTFRSLWQKRNIAGESKHTKNM